MLMKQLLTGGGDYDKTLRQRWWAALALLAGLLYLLFRPYRESGGVRLNERSAARA